MDFTRQLGIFNPKKFRNMTVAVIGCGAIGSITTLLLAKLGFRRFVLFDMDLIETHNLPNQFYFTRQNGMKKNEALREVIQTFSDDIESVELKEKLENDTLLPYDIVVVALDNMKFRKIAFEQSEKFARLFVDARMGGQVFRLYTINMKSEKDKEMYKKTLYSDKKATEDKCTARSIIFNTMGIASFIGKNITAFLTEKPYAREIIMDYYNMELIKNV